MRVCRTLLLFVVLLCISTFADVGNVRAVDWPLRISATGKYLEDQLGVPFPIIGDTAWSMAGQIGPADVITYLNDRQAKGFNTIEVNAIEHYFSDNAPNNYNNDPPFTNGPSDWSVRNEAYWAHVDYIIQEARNRGILVLLYPAYLGFLCGDQGWCAQMQSQMNATMTNYGQWLGNRYKNLGNIMWVHGGDANANSYPNAYSRVAALASGIKSADPASLHSASSSRTRSGMDDYNALLDINTIYSDGLIDTETKREYQRNGAKPVYFYEGLYEGEGAGPLENQSQALIPYLGGSLVGALFGNNPIWHFCGAGCSGANDWIGSLNSPGSISMSNIGKLIRSRKWYNLVPDYDNTVATSSKGSGFLYSATAREKTGETVMVWFPTTSQVTVNMTKISGTQANAWWWNPDDNSSVLIGTYSTTGAMNFTPSSERKVLVLDDNSKGFLPPGTGEAPPPPPPSLSVTEGSIGTVITITGSGFGDKKGKVLIGDVVTKQAVATKIAKDGWGESTITCTITKVPEGSPGTFPITVQTKSIGATSLTLNDAFTLQPPDVDSYSSDHGAPGDDITIDGSFFGTKKGKIYLAYTDKNGKNKLKSCKITSWKMNQILFVVPKLRKGPSTLGIANKLGSMAIGGFEIN